MIEKQNKYFFKKRIINLLKDLLNNNFIELHFTNIHQILTLGFELNIF